MLIARYNVIICDDLHFLIFVFLYFFALKIMNIYVIGKNSQNISVISAFSLGSPA